MALPSSRKEAPPLDLNNFDLDDGSSAASTPIESQPRHLRTCNRCRHRKVKCDRQQPCNNCATAATACIYPLGPGRAPKRPRRVLESQLMDRLSKLEGIIRQLESNGATQSSGDDSPILGGQVRTSSQDARIDQHLGRLMVDDTRSYYVNSTLWEGLGNEIEELRDMLHESAISDPAHNASAETLSYELASSSTSNAALLGFRALAHSLQPLHPPLPQSVALLRLFSENVAPLVHILHMPTTVGLYWDAMASLSSPDKDMEALLFSIYYSAIVSMGPQQCVHHLGVSKETALDKYRFAAEQAMARANLLNTQSIILIQAAVLFIYALRNEDNSRTAWSLMCLVYHIAQAMGLHRDGTTFGLKPLETELRRRLWHCICILDSRLSEYHGYKPIVQDSLFDTKLPLNINDSDLTAGMAEPPNERGEVTEMTFLLIRCEVVRTCRRIESVSSGARTPGAAENGASPTPESHGALVDGLRQRIEQRYLRHCDTSVPFSRFISTVARQMIAMTWLKAHYPLSRKDGGLDVDLRNQLFHVSIEVLGAFLLLTTEDLFPKWSWHSKTYIGWHAVAFVLSELCSRPPSGDCDRAWVCATAVYDRLIRDGEEQGIMWRPIRRLMAKARYLREMQRIDSQGYAQTSTSSDSSPIYSVGGRCPDAASSSAPILSSSFLAEATGDDPPIYSTAPDMLISESLYPTMNVNQDLQRVNSCGSSFGGQAPVPFEELFSDQLLADMDVSKPEAAGASSL